MHKKHVENSDSLLRGYFYIFYKTFKRDTTGTTRNYGCVASCTQSTSLECCQTSNCNKVVPQTNVTTCSVGSVNSDSSNNITVKACPSTANKFCKVRYNQF